jgi:O-antigen ligase
LFVTVVETESDRSTATGATEAADAGRSQFARWGLTSHDLLVLTAGVLFCVGSGPFEFRTWTLRMATLLAGLPLGALLLARLARRRDKAAIAALVFLSWAVVGAAASGAPWRSFLGQVDGNSQSVLIFAGVFGFWALARSLSDRGRALVGPVIVAALGVSALIGVLQIVLDIRSGPLASVGGRANGLESNAAYFSAPLCAAVAWCATISESAAEARSRLLGLAGVVFFALAIGLSGTRISIIAITVAIAVLCFRARNLRSLRVVGAAIAGLGSSLVLQRLFLSGARSGANTVERFAAGGTRDRIEVWKAGMSAFRDRPILGWGLGRVRVGIQHHFTPEFVRLYQPDDSTSGWTDVHNFIVQMLVAVGIVGVVALTVFVLVAFRKVDFGLALAAVAVSINWLLQPAVISSLAVAAIFLGAAAMRLAPAEQSRRRTRAATVSAVAVGVTAALALIAADVHLKVAVQAGDMAGIRTAAAWYGNDPFVIDEFVLGSYQQHLASDQPARVAAARRAVAAEPDVPTWWNELAMTQWDSGDFAGMRASIEAALELQPNHVRSWVQLTAYAKHVGDAQLEAVARSHACELGAPVCAQP